jgi:hypothetical protein
MSPKLWIMQEFRLLPLLYIKLNFIEVKYMLVWVRKILEEWIWMCWYPIFAITKPAPSYADHAIRIRNASPALKHSKWSTKSALAWSAPTWTKLNQPVKVHNSLNNNSLPNWMPNVHRERIMSYLSKRVNIQRDLMSISIKYLH